MKTFYLLANFCALFVTGSLAAEAAEKAKPNIVLFVADDLNRYDVGCYGAVNTRTPNIDSLARAGMKMNNAYCAFAQCAPCRAELYSGRFPANNGLIGNGIPSRSDIQCVVQYLRAVGYRTGLVGKHHCGPGEVYDFDNLNKKTAVAPPTDRSKSEVRKNKQQNKAKSASDEANSFDKNDGKDIEDYFDSIREYMARKGEQPFFLAACSHQPHVPWTKGNAAAFDQAKLVVPKNLFDCPETREELTHYYAEVEYLDWQVGEVMKIVDELGLKEKTLFMFVTEQGASLPGGKFTCYEAGVHAGMVVRWPGVIAPGAQSDAMVHYADVTPTLVQAAGGKIEDKIDGWSFLDVLQGKAQKHRDYAYGFSTSALPRATQGGFPIRSVTDGRDKLIINYQPEKVFKSPGMVGAYKDWKRMAATNDKARFFVEHFEKHPTVELYDCNDDPWELTNMAGNPEKKEALDRLTKELQNWLEGQQDDPVKTEVLALGGRNAKRAKSGKEEMQGSAGVPSQSNQPEAPKGESRREMRQQRKAAPSTPSSEPAPKPRP